MKDFKRLLLPVTLVSVLFSCGNDSVKTVSTEHEPQICFMTRLVALKLPDVINDTNLAGYLNLEINQFKDRIYPDSSIHNTIYYYSNGYFCKSYLGYNVGTITANNDSLLFECIQPECVGCVPTCEYHLYYNSYEFNNQIVTWNISGNSTVHPFQIQLQAPQSVAAITSPTINTNISRYSPLNLKWEVSLQSGHNQARIKMNKMNGNYTDDKNYYTDDTGSFTIPSEDLLKYKTTDFIQVILFIGKNTAIEYSAGKYILAEIYSSLEVSFAFND